MSHEHDDDDGPVQHTVFITTGGPPVLRWSFFVLIADVLGMFGGFGEVVSNFFNEQARSFAASASYREEARDRRDLTKDVERDLEKLPVVTEED